MSDVRTFLLDGVNADTVSYTLAPGLAQFIQAVYIEVDNTAGGDARPTLSVSEQSGVVIAKKRQGEAIAAGDTGSATWALRLTDEGAGASANGIEFDKLNVGDWLSVETTSDHNGRGMEFDCDSGDYAIFMPQSGPGEMQLQGYDFRWEGPIAHFRLREDGVVTLGGLSVLQTYAADSQTNATLHTFVITLAGSKLEVQNHLGAPIFRVDEDGSLHGKTGKSLVFDL